MEWQPIKTAPKDGTPIIVYTGEKVDRNWQSSGICDHYAIAIWEYGNWCTIECEDCGMMNGEMTGWMEDWQHIRIEPICWCPLLPPPDMNYFSE